ncbi:MAG TPA: DUF1972 domain-containing protein, partial [Planctomycetota bacterium]|nr:DUF1972 domain-containing protein [Planctomycetota bacterium]
IVGSRGIPARYGGFETFAQEIALRLADRGVEVTVFCEAKAGGRPVRYGKVRLEYVHAPFSGPLARILYDLGSLCRTRSRYDVVYMLGYGSSFLCWIPRLFGSQVWINMDGLEWQRSKWGRFAQCWLKTMEGIACRIANRLIFDNGALGQAIADRRPKLPPSSVLAYGAPVVSKAPDVARVRTLGLEPGRYLLVVCRFEPENHLLEIVRAASQREGGAPVVVVSSTAESTHWQREVMAHAGPLVRFLGAVYDPVVLRALRYHCLAYLHGHSVGGTNPSLLEAMGCGNLVLAHDNPYNREVLGEMGRYFADESEFYDRLWDVERMSERQRRMIGDGARDRVINYYSWDSITDGYISLLSEGLAHAKSPNLEAVRQASSS